jgi:CBS domain-containing protein
MLISEIMHTGVFAVRPNTPAATARQHMRTHGIHHLLVREGAQLVGVVSARDLARGGQRPNQPKRLLVSEYMSPHVVIADPDTSVHRAANMMRGRSIGCLIVADNGTPVGIVTLSDLLRQVAEKPRHRLDRRNPPALHYRVPHRKQHRSGTAW